MQNARRAAGGAREGRGPCPHARANAGEEGSQLGARSRRARSVWAKGARHQASRQGEKNAHSEELIQHLVLYMRSSFSGQLSLVLQGPLSSRPEQSRGKQAHLIRRLLMPLPQVSLEVIQHGGEQAKVGREFVDEPERARDVVCSRSSVMLSYSFSRRGSIHLLPLPELLHAPPPGLPPARRHPRPFPA